MKMNWIENMDIGCPVCAHQGNKRLEWIWEKQNLFLIYQMYTVKQNYCNSENKATALRKNWKSGDYSPSDIQYIILDIFTNGLYMVWLYFKCCTSKQI